MVFERVPKTSSASHAQPKSNSALPTRPWTYPLQEQATADNQITPSPKYQSNLLLRLLETSEASNKRQPQEDIQQVTEKPNVQMKCAQCEAEETLQTYSIESTATESDARVCQNQLKQERQKSATSIANPSTQKPQSPQSSSGLSTPTHSNTSTTVAQHFDGNIIEIDSEIKDNPEEIWIKIFLARHRDWSRQQAIQWIQQQKARNGQFKDGDILLRYHGPFPYPQTQNKFYAIVEEFIYQQQSESTNSEPQWPTAEAGQPSELSGELIPSVPNRLSFLLPAQQQTIAIKDAADWVRYIILPSQNGNGVILSSPHTQTRNSPSLPTRVWKNTLYPLVQVQRQNGSIQIYGIGKEIPLFVGDIVSIPLFYPSSSNGSEPSDRTASSDNSSIANEPTNTRTSESLSGQGQNEEPPTQGKDIHQYGIVYNEEGVNLRDKPLPGNQSTVLKRLSFNAKLFVDRELSGDWYYVTLTTGEHGYVAASYIKTNLPEPGAKLHKIKQGESAIGIAEQYYKQNVQPGEDLRFYVNVLVYANQGSGIYKAKPEDSWENVQTQANYLIWIPSVEFARTLKGLVRSGSISREAWTEAKKVATTVGNFALGGGAFVAGLLHGALESVWDTLVGLKDLAVMAWDILESLLQGTILADAQKLWDSLSKLNVAQLIEAGLEQLSSKWNDPIF